MGVHSWRIGILSGPEGSVPTIGSLHIPTPSTLTGKIHRRHPHQLPNPTSALTPAAWIGSIALISSQTPDREKHYLFVLGKTAGGNAAHSGIFVYVLDLGNRILRRKIARVR
jgi:hypothetical protein